MIYVAFFRKKLNRKIFLVPSETQAKMTDFLKIFDYDKFKTNFQKYEQFFRNVEFFAYQILMITNFPSFEKIFKEIVNFLIF